MSHLLPFLIALLMIATAGVLLAGIIGLARGSADPRRSNQLMRWRIILQAGALLLFVLMLALVRG
ncbi:MAG: twin transmembrane helix small protein [Acetobacteraceae bacterium]